MIKNLLNHIIPFRKDYLHFLLSQTSRISFKDFVLFKIKLLYIKYIRGDSFVYWPIHKNTLVTHPENIYVGINSNVGIMPGNYIQGNGGIYIGDYVDVSLNVGIISGNHDVYDQTKHINKEVRIDDYCWIGMNCVILPGVHLGPRTVVGAGSIVTKSFPEGYCVIGGSPAKLIRKLERELFIPSKSEIEYYGFIPIDKFQIFCKKYLNKNKYYKNMINANE